MKALSVRQPWATFIIDGLKTIEVRSWPTKFRGRLAIHVSQKLAGGFRAADWVDLPRGAIIGTVEVVGCKPLTPEAAKLAGFDDATPEECEGLYGWELARPRKCEPIPCSGALSLWRVPDDAEVALTA